MTVTLSKTGFITAQRTLDTPWLDWVNAPDVALVALDPAATVMDLTEPGPKLAYSSPVTDQDGTRQAVLYVPEGVTCNMVLPDQSTQVLRNVTVRQTEHSVGDLGPVAMPADLGPSDIVAYNTCYSFTCDEAIQAGATRVNFDPPLVQYSDVYQGFGTGYSMPVGFYDVESQKWLQNANGRVMRVLNVDGGVAALDVDGSGQPADSATLAALGITPEEQAVIATVYAPNDPFLRVGDIRHFSAGDYNPGPVPPNDAVDPDCRHQRNGRCGCNCSRSEDDANQVDRQSQPAEGSPHDLHYASDRAPGRKDGRKLDVQLSGSTLPASVRSMKLEVQVAGQKIEETFPPQTDFHHIVEWNGKDAYDRVMNGFVPCKYRVAYTYPAYYAQYGATPRAFGSRNWLPAASPAPTRQDVTVWSPWQTEMLGGYDARGSGLGGFTLDVHHVYSPSDRTVHLGNGDIQGAEGTGPVARWITHPGSSLGEGIPASDYGPGLTQQSGVLSMPDGSIYLADTQRHRIRRVTDDGLVFSVAGTGSLGYAGDGGPALAAELHNPTRICAGPDRSVYFLDQQGLAVRRIDPSGTITTVAGTGVAAPGGVSPDGGLATSTPLRECVDLAVDSGGNLYLAEYLNNRIRMVNTEGILSTVAGNLTRGFSGDGGMATQARLNHPRGIAIGPDGALYIADTENHRIRVVQGGIIRTIAGTGTRGSGGDGGPALLATLNFPVSLEFFDGGLALTQNQDGAVSASQRLIRVITAEGVMTTLAGNGQPTPGNVAGAFDAKATSPPSRPAWGTSPTWPPAPTDA